MNKWKIIFTKHDRSKSTLTNKVYPLDLRLATKYNEQFGNNCISKTVFIYPLKNHEPIGLDEYIAKLKLIETENNKCFLSK